MSHYGFTGTQRGMTYQQRQQLLVLLRDRRWTVPSALWFHHGDCVGADAEAAALAASLGFKIWMHPPTNPAKRAFTTADREEAPMLYLDRNHAIVDVATEVFATPGEYEMQQRSGTWATIRYARKVEKSVLIIYPDGSLETS